jgi:hypothetical protein
MAKIELTKENIRGELFAAFPELLEQTWAEFGSYYQLEKGTEQETPGMYPIFEDVVQRVMFELLESDRDATFLVRLFHFFEDMANSSDLDISRGLLGIAILENLVYKTESLSRAWKYMGPKMTALATAEKESRENPPPV